MEPKGKKSVRIDFDTWKSLSHASTESGKDIYELITEAWICFTAPRTQQADPPRPSKGIHRNTEWHDRLDVILDHGSKEDVTGIQANLRWGAESVEKRRGATKSRAAS